MARIWDLISNEALADLMRWQHKHHPGVKLKPPQTITDDNPVSIITLPETEEEIDKIVRQAPKTYHGEGE